MFCLAYSFSLYKLKNKLIIFCGMSQHRALEYYFKCKTNFDTRKGGWKCITDGVCKLNDFLSVRQTWAKSHTMMSFRSWIWLGVFYPLHLFITTGIKSKMTDNFVKVEQKRAPGPSVMSYKRLQQWDAATKTILDTIFQRDRVNGIISSWLMEVKLIRLHKYIEGIKWNWWKCWPEEKRHKRKFRSNSQQIRMLELLSCDCCVRKCLFIKLVMLSSVN